MDCQLSTQNQSSETRISIDQGKLKAYDLDYNLHCASLRFWTEDISSKLPLGMKIRHSPLEVAHRR